MDIQLRLQKSCLINSQRKYKNSEIYGGKTLAQAHHSLQIISIHTVKAL